MNSGSNFGPRTFELQFWTLDVLGVGAVAVAGLPSESS